MSWVGLHGCTEKLCTDEEVGSNSTAARKVAYTDPTPARLALLGGLSDNFDPQAWKAVSAVSSLALRCGVIGE
jgi:hypothetical protein